MIYLAVHKQVQHSSIILHALCIILQCEYIDRILHTERLALEHLPHKDQIGT